MSSPKHKPRILRYLLTSLGITLGLMAAKALIAWGADFLLHPIPILGGWIQSLELIELTNIVIFALLGFGLGGATCHLSGRTPLWQKSLVLFIALPLVFLTSYWVRQTLWLQQIASSSELNYAQAIEIANQALASESGDTGFWGYFCYTTQMPILPTSLSDIQRLADDQKWFRSELTRFSGIEPGIFTLIFTGAGWGIRGFHIIVAGLTGIIYFVKGLAWADATRLRRQAIAKP